MSTTLQRSVWDGHPMPLGNAFEMGNRKGARELHAVCRLESHLFGWQLVLEVGGLLSRSQVCRSREEVLDVSEHWRTVMLQAGWTARGSGAMHDTL
jgi:hypothetical protein